LCVLCGSSFSQIIPLASHHGAPSRLPKSSLWLSVALCVLCGSSFSQIIAMAFHHARAPSPLPKSSLWFFVFSAVQAFPNSSLWLCTTTALHLPYLSLLCVLCVLCGSSFSQIIAMSFHHARAPSPLPTSSLLSSLFSVFSCFRHPF